MKFVVFLSLAHFPLSLYFSYLRYPLPGDSSVSFHVFPLSHVIQEGTCMYPQSTVTQEYHSENGAALESVFSHPVFLTEAFVKLPASSGEFGLLVAASVV